MTNPDHDELVKLADELIAQNYGNVRDIDTMGEHFALLAKAATALRRLASFDGGVKVRDLLWVRSTVFGGFKWRGMGEFGEFACFMQDDLTIEQQQAKKDAAQANYEARIKSALVEAPAVKGEPEPVAWPANLNPRTLDLVQRFALALAKKLRLAEEKYGHADGWSRDDWESECRDHLYQHLEKGDPRDVAAYCAFMWHRGWITYRPEITAQPADAGMREALGAELSEIFERFLSAHDGDKAHLADVLREWLWDNKAGLVSALTAPGATTKSDGVRWGDSGPIPGQHFGDEFAAEPSPSDPSSTRSDVTVLCGLDRPSESQCPNMKEVGGGMDGERYSCAVCGKGYYIDYDDMR